MVAACGRTADDHGAGEVRLQTDVSNATVTSLDAFRLERLSCECPFGGIVLGDVGQCRVVVAWLSRAVLGWVRSTMRLMMESSLRLLLESSLRLMRIKSILGRGVCVLVLEEIAVRRRNEPVVRLIVSLLGLVVAVLRILEVLTVLGILSILRILSILKILAVLLKLPTLRILSALRILSTLGKHPVLILRSAVKVMRPLERTRSPKIQTKVLTLAR